LPFDISPLRKFYIIYTNKIFLGFFPPHGTASPETFRFFEAMNFGCVVIAPEQPNNWIYKDSPHYKLENNLYSQVINILKNPPDNKMFYDYSEKIGSENTAKYIKEQI